MVKLRYSRPAVDDLKSIYDFIAFDSPYYAKQFVKDIKEKIKTLKKYPEFGRKIETDKFNDLRQILHKNYRIIYIYNDSTINIVTIHHQSRELGNIESLKPFEI